jgi:tyrosyl-tRNA synthetase
MNIYQELKARGFIYQETDSALIEKKLTSEKVVFYCGFDPTGDSLHVGHLLPVMAMRMLQKAGHVPTVLVGGATGAIGDPSGRSTARNMLTLETVAHNVECLKSQLARFITLENGEAYFVNNYDWLGKIKLLDFLRDVGSRFSVNRMMSQKSVESRMENGLSFLEFSYSLHE